jgi:hypothetical protein
MLKRQYIIFAILIASLVINSYTVLGLLTISHDGQTLFKTGFVSGKGKDGYKVKFEHLYSTPVGMIKWNSIKQSIEQNWFTAIGVSGDGSTIYLAEEDYYNNNGTLFYKKIDGGKWEKIKVYTQEVIAKLFFK